jgi:hypothetical protein
MWVASCCVVMLPPSLDRSAGSKGDWVEEWRQSGGRGGSPPAGSYCRQWGQLATSPLHYWHRPTAMQHWHYFLGLPGAHPVTRAAVRVLHSQAESRGGLPLTFQQLPECRAVQLAAALRLIRVCPLPMLQLNCGGLHLGPLWRAAAAGLSVGGTEGVVGVAQRPASRPSPPPMKHGIR